MSDSEIRIQMYRFLKDLAAELRRYPLTTNEVVNRTDAVLLQIRGMREAA
jgi:hypothetical protein